MPLFLLRYRSADHEVIGLAVVGARRPPSEDGVTIFLRKMKAHAVIEGRDPGSWSNDDDYAVVEGKLIGRIYGERVPRGETKW
jgi:hypothetical protein